jgi:hypothetical protein
MAKDAGLGELARQCARHWVSRTGRLARPAQLDRVLRAAAIAGLYLCERIESSGVLAIDTSPSGDEGIDVLLAFVEMHPSVDLAELLARGPSLRAAVTSSLVASDVWQRRPLGRVVDLDPGSILLPRSSDLARVATGDHPADAFTSSLAMLLHPLTNSDASVYRRSGPAGPFLRDYVARYGHDKLRGRDALGAILDIFG